MTLRPRTIRRLMLAAAVMLACAVALSVWGSKQAERHAQRLEAERERGLAAWRAGDWAGAEQVLGRYLHEADSRQLRRDFDVRFAYGMSRAHVPAPGGRHFAQATAVLRGLAEDARRTPRSVDVRHGLLNVLAASESWSALKAEADTLLDAYPDDPTSLRLRRLAAERTGDISTALVLSRRLNDLNPRRLDDQVQTLRLLARSDRSPAELVAHAAELRDRFRDDPQFLLLLAIAYDHAGQSQQAIACLEQAASADWASYYDDDSATRFVRRLGGLFDSFGQHERVLPVLAEAVEVYVAADRTPPPGIKRGLALRQWQAGRLEEARDTLASVAENDVAADGQLLAVSALLHFEAGDAQRGRRALRTLERIIDGLEEEARQDGSWRRLPDSGGLRSTQRILRAWVDSLYWVYLEEPDAGQLRRRLTQLHTALARIEHLVPRTWPGGDEDTTGVLQKMLGDTYAVMGEHDLAVRWWRASARMMPGWPAPLIAIAEAEREAGQLVESETAAREAATRVTGAAGDEVAVLLTRIAYRRWQLAPSNPGADRAAALAADHQRAHPFHPGTLAIHVHLTALSNPEAARRLVGAAVEAGLDEPQRVALARVSRSAQLEMEEQLLNGLEGLEATELRAQMLADSGDLAGAVRLLRAGAQEVSRGERLVWDLAEAKLLERSGSPEAVAAWRALGDGNPDSLEVQLAVVESGRLARADREFVGRTTERLRRLTGDHGRRWRLEQARWLIESNEPRRAMEALDLLHELIRTGESLDARLLLADGLELAGNPLAALAHLQWAFEADPTRGDVGLRLMSRLEGLGRREEARRVLSWLAAEGVKGSQERLEVAARLADRGEVESAINVLEQAQAAGDLDLPGRVVLAELLDRAGRHDQAEVLYDELLSFPQRTPAVLLSAAVHHGRQGRTERAQEIIAQVGSTRLSTLEQSVVRASFHAQLEQTEPARALFREVVTQRPAYASPWREAVMFELSQGEPEVALDLITEAWRALRDGRPDDRLQTLEVEARAISYARGSPRHGSGMALDSLLDAVERASLTAQQRERWSAIMESAESMLGKLEEAPEGELPQVTELTLARLEEAARRLPRLVPLHGLLVEQYQARGEQSEAVRVGRRIAEAARFDPEAQRLAYAVCRESGRYAEAERYAQRWRERFAGDPIWPDTAVADARIMQGDFSGAMEVIAPHIAHARENAREFGHLLALAAEAHAAAGQYAQARELISPNLRASPAWRATATRLAAERVGDLGEAAEWLRMVEIAGTEVDDQERLRVAGAWVRLGLRFEDRRALVRGREQLRQLTEGQLKQHAPAWLAVARAWQFDGNRGEAELAFRRVLALAPRHAEAANELAFLLLQRWQELLETALPGAPAPTQDAIATTPMLAEALTWAGIATAEAPGEPAYHDTLARVHFAMGERPAARQAFERALRLDPGHLDAMLGLACLLLEAGETDSAHRLFSRLQTVYQASPPENEHLRREYQRLAETFELASGE